jgi:hypothetical protein
MSFKNPQADRQWREPWKRSEVGTDYSIILSRVPWEFFGTPTFSGRVPRPDTCQAIFENWKRRIIEAFDVPQKNLLVALRGEVGEKTGRFHYHYLLGGTFSRNGHADAKRLEFFWKQVSHGARVVVRQYDRSRSGPEYVSKCLGANSYEVSKYAFANSVTLSASVVRLITHLDAMGERRCRADNRNNGLVVNASGAINASAFPAASNLCDETASQIVGKNEAAMACPR